MRKAIFSLRFLFLCFIFYTESTGINPYGSRSNVQIFSIGKKEREKANRNKAEISGTDAVDNLCKFIFLCYNNQNRAYDFVTYIQPEKIGVGNMRKKEMIAMLLAVDRASVWAC